MNTASSSRTSPNNHTAFTLVELLVVLAIIMILAGIAMPVFNGVIEKGKATTDASNLRQIGVGLKAYLADHDDQMIETPNGHNWILDDYNNSTLHPKYLPIYKVFQSPWDKRPASEVMATAPVSYGFNLNILTPASNNTEWKGKMTKIKNPMVTVLMANAYSGNPDLVAAWTGNAKIAKVLYPAMESQPKGTHGSGKLAKILFCDIHVDTLKFKELQDLKTVPQLWDPLAGPK